jgi:hypothetical protein
VDSGVLDIRGVILFRQKRGRDRRSRLLSVSSAARGRVSHMRDGPILTQEEVVRIRTWSTNLKDLHHIEELAMDITDNGDGCSDVNHIALLHEQLLSLCAYCLYDRLRKQLLLGQPGYTFIQVYAGW